MRKNCKTFDEWCYSMWMDFIKTTLKTINIHQDVFINSDKSTTVFIMNSKTGKTAFAKCKESDKYSPKAGIAIAWARYKRIPIPNFSLQLGELKQGEEFIYKFHRYKIHETTKGNFIIAFPDKGDPVILSPETEVKRVVKN
jgi:hypothetical protein